MSEPPTHRVLARLGSVRKQGGSYMAKCPAHDDGKPSLSVAEGEDGRAVLHCHAGCPPDRVVEAIGLAWSDLLPTVESNGHATQELGAYNYTDERGELLFQVVRFVPKAFRQRRPDGRGGWTWNLNGTRRVLYRLPEVINAVVNGRTVYVVAGEKDSDAIARAGEIGTCNPGGAGRWSKVPDAGKVLAGATVVVVADKDPPGRQHAREVATDLRRHGCTVTIVEAKTGKDAADHLVAHGVDEFVEVPLVGEDADGRTVVARRVSEIEAAPVRFAYEERVVLGEVNLVGGREGMGKGIFVTHLVARWTHGQVPGDLYGKPVTVAMMSVEDDPSRVLRPRLEAAGADLTRVVFLTASEDGRDDTIVLPTDADRVAAAIRAAGARMLVVDVPNAFLAGGFDVYKDHDVRRGVMTPFQTMAAKLDIAVILIVHLNRAPTTALLDRFAGSLGLPRASRCALAVVENPENPDERVAVLAKNNLGRLDVPSIKFRIEGVEIETPTGTTTAGRLVHLGDAPEVTARNALHPVDEEQKTAVAQAMEWLTDLLADGSIPSVEAKKKGTEHMGFSASTVERAWRQLGIKPRKEGFGKDGIWYLDPPSRKGSAPISSKDPYLGVEEQVTRKAGHDEIGPTPCHSCATPTPFLDDDGRPWCTECIPVAS